MLTNLLGINSNYNVKEMKMLTECWMTEISIEKNDNNWPKRTNQMKEWNSSISKIDEVRF